jgi:class 3 adenylate cyclase
MEQEQYEDLLQPHVDTELRLLPYCKVCHVPIRGFRAVFSRMRGITPDPTNPQFCSKCSDYDFAPCEQVVTVLFCDIRNYTGISEQRTPTEMVDLLNRYFAYVSRIIINNNGVVEKFVGDAVMCFFNAPLPDERHEAVAVETAMQIRHAMHAMKISGVEVGIGINTGVARVGKLGSEASKAYGAIGDCVNVAARLQAEAKGDEIVIGYTTWLNAQDAVPPTIPRRECELELKGKSAPVRCIVLGHP